jgi:hypothetical protein
VRWRSWTGDPERMKWVVWGLAVLGIALRLSQYAFDRSLFLDEVFVATNIIQRSIGELRTTLEFDQRAPVGFLVAVKVTTLAFGTSDLALRLVPLASGIAGVLLFAALARRVAGPVGSAVAMLLFALSPTMIFFSSDLKQYSTDAAATLAILLLAWQPQPGRRDSRRMLAIAVVGAVCIWLSFTSVFVLAAVGLACGIPLLAERRFRELGGWSIAASLWAVSAVGVYFVQIRNLDPDPSWKGLWGADFLPIPPRSIHDVLWVPRKVIHLVTSPVGISFGGAAATAFIAGAVSLFARNRRQAAVLLAPIAVAMLVSATKAYPFAGRAIVFLAPIVLLVAAVGVEAIHRQSTGTARLAAWLVLLFVAFQPLEALGGHVARRRMYTNTSFYDYKFEETKPVMQYIRQRWQPGDVVYLYSDARVSFSYYADQFGLDGCPTIRGIQSALMNPTWDQVEHDLAQLRGRKRVWVYFTHVWQLNGVDDRKLYLYYLDRWGQRLDAYEPPPGQDAWAYLYDLSGPDVARTDAGPSR